MEYTFGYLFLTTYFRIVITKKIQFTSDKYSPLAALVGEY